MQLNARRQFHLLLCRVVDVNHARRESLLESQPDLAVLHDNDLPNLWFEEVRNVLKVTLV